MSEPKEPKSKPDSLRKQALLSERTKKFDPNVTPQQAIDDLRAVQKEFEDKYISRTLYRAEGSYSEQSWVQHFGTFAEFRRQAGLESSRQNQVLERQIAKQASVDHYREYFYKEVLPYHQKYEVDHTGDILSIMVCSDLHDLEADEFALSVFLAECKRKQPDIIIFNGDIYDLYEFSKYHKDPRECKPVERLKFVHDKVWKVVREACPKAQIDLVIGNHEYRLLRVFADSNPYLKVILSDFVGLKMKDIFGLDTYRINLHAKLDLACYNQSDINKQLDQNYKIYSNCFVANHKPTDRFGISGTNGHLHNLYVKQWTNISQATGKENRCTWLQTPALHKLDAGYIEGISQAQMGFSSVVLSQSTKEVIQTPHIVNPTWTLIDGIIYRRK